MRLGDVLQGLLPPAPGGTYCLSLCSYYKANSTIKEKCFKIRYFKWKEDLTKVYKEYLPYADCVVKGIYPSFYRKTTLIFIDNLYPKLMIVFNPAETCNDEA